MAAVSRPTSRSRRRLRPGRRKARPVTAPGRRLFLLRRVLGPSPVRGRAPWALSRARRSPCPISSRSSSRRRRAARPLGLLRHVSRAARPLVRRRARVPVLPRVPGPSPALGPVRVPPAAVPRRRRVLARPPVALRVPARCRSRVRAARVPVTTRSRPTPAAWASPGRRVPATTAVAAAVSATVVTVRRRAARFRVRRRAAAARPGRRPVRVPVRRPAVRVRVPAPVRAVPVPVVRVPTR